MPKFRIFALAVALFVFAGIPQAKAADPCDPAVMSQMSTAASAGFNRLSDIAVTFMKPPSPAASSDCLRSLMNVWQIDPVALIAGFFPTGTLGYTIGGFTLTGSSPASIIIGLISNWFQAQFGSMVCGELWSGIGESLRRLNFNADGSINIAGSLAGNMGTIGGSIITIMNGGTATVQFPGGFTGSFTQPPP